MQALILFLHLAAFWWLWSGFFDPTLLFYGFLSCAFVVAAAARAKVLDRESLPFQMIFRSMTYLPWLLFEIVKSNIAVAKIVLHPNLPMRPHVMRTESSQKTDVGKVIFANSITLTPGTITLAVRDREIVVHALADAFAEDLLGGEMDRRVCKMEGEA
ncbi:MAG: multicomponent Na+:H+ antiporter subunit E [Myxococcota bacterium]|jgi:multicomponent Na+:H+ antiporter subunit E